MGDRGPLPTDPDILELRGSRLSSNREINVEKEQKKPKCPRHLGKHGKRKWKEIVADLEVRGILSKSWESSLELLAMAYERMMRLEEELGEDPSSWTKTTEKGYPVIDPLVSVRNQAASEYLKLLDRFGCSPATRIKAKGAGKPGRKSGVASRQRGKAAS